MVTKISVWREYDTENSAFFVVKLPSGYLVRDEDGYLWFVEDAGSHREAVMKVIKCEYGEVKEVRYAGGWDIENMRAVDLPEEE